MCATAGRSREDLALAIQEAEAMLQEEAPQLLSVDELHMYKERGFVVARGIVPEKLADVIREQIIHLGLKEGRLDVHDPSTWGGTHSSLSLWNRFLCACASESSFFGRRLGFGCALDRNHRTDVSQSDFDLLMRAWNLANTLARRKLSALMDQIAGPGAWRCCGSAEGDVLKRDLHARYALPVKAPQFDAHFRWPLVGWHIDGHFSSLFLGKRVETLGRRDIVPAHACVGMLAWNKTHPKGGMTGVLCGSHRKNMRTILAAEKYGGITNLMLLIHQSFFGGAASDPISLAPPEQVMSPGDMLLMHPYLTHSSSWNFQHCLRLGGHIQFDYKEPMETKTLVAMATSQAHESAELGCTVPANSDLILEALDNAGFARLALGGYRISQIRAAALACLSGLERYASKVQFWRRLRQ